MPPLRSEEKVLDQSHPGVFNVLKVVSAIAVQSGLLETMQIGILPAICSAAFT